MARILWSQLEEVWTPSGKGWESTQPRHFCKEVFSLSLSAQPTGLWDWQSLTPSTIDANEVLQAREKITELWRQHVLITFNVHWRWRNGMQDEEGRWTEEQAAAIHIGAIRTETQYLQTGMHRTRASRRLGWTILKKLKDQSIIEQSPNEGALTMYTLYFTGQVGPKPRTGRAGAVVVRSSEAGTAADIIWSMGMSLTGTTYNQAIYEGLISGLAEAQKNSWTPLELVGDSALIPRHLTKHRPLKKKKLLGFYAVARRLADTLGIRHWYHHQREFNRMARAAATNGKTTRLSATALNPTEQPGLRKLAMHLSGGHARWQSSYWSRALVVT